MAFKLVCVAPLHGFEKGQEVTDPEVIAKLSTDHGHHFVRVAVPDGPTPEDAPVPVPLLQGADTSHRRG